MNGWPQEILQTKILSPHQIDFIFSGAFHSLPEEHAMSITVNFKTQGKSVELSPKELHDLHNAITFALSGSSISSKTFGAIRVETNGKNVAFSQAQTDSRTTTNAPELTDC